MPTDLHVDLDLIRRYNKPGPRYTSYPTAPHLTALKREIDLAVEHLNPERPVTQIHWGGGTPSYLTADQIRDLGTHLHDRFSIAPDAEISLEADPRTLTKDRLAAAASVGFNRLSVGVQDVNRKVQEAINRVQSLRQIRDIVDWGRRFDFNGINVDLIYGLPYQTPERFDRTLTVASRLQPDRIALYSYAHVPSVKPHQRAIDEDALPAPEDKLRLFKRGIERLTGDEGYRFIGMDHFARPDDALSRAQDEGKLQRNFQGYSTRAGAEIVAFGVSGISQFAEAYAQNVKPLPDYYEQIDEGRVPTKQGYRLTPSDRLRRHVIMQLMCDFHLDKAAVENRFGIDFDTTFDTALRSLKPLEADGLVTLTPDAIHVRPPGRLLIRNVAMAFDAYLQTQEETPVHAQTV